jgi:magnesium chelatase family protein
VRQIQQHRGRISGPLLDRIDLRVEVRAVSRGELLAREKGEDSTTIRQRVEAARTHQRERFEGGSHFTNAGMTAQEVETYCRLEGSARQLLGLAVTELGVSARGCNRILKVARTIADLAAATQIDESHLSEALQYRSFDVRAWQGEKSHRIF